MNGKRYVGQGIDIPVRWKRHRYNLRKNLGKPNKHLQNAWNKYGEESFVFETLEYCPIEILDKRETYWIKHFKSDEKEFGYNKDIPTGDGKRIVCEETRKLISQNQNKNTIDIKESYRKRNEFRAKPFSLISPEGTIVRGNNIKAFCLENGLERTNLSSVLNGRRPHHKGWRKA